MIMNKVESHNSYTVAKYFKPSIETMVGSSYPIFGTIYCSHRIFKHVTAVVCDLIYCDQGSSWVESSV